MQTRPLIITGADGMLGSAVKQAAINAGISYFAFNHSDFDITSYDLQIPYGAVIVNCAGLIPVRQSNPRHIIKVNGFGPHNLAWLCGQVGGRLIQISTDCVFSGKSIRPANYNSYTEYDISDPIDMYGISKRAGEVTYGNNLTIRTSFLGLGNHGLIHWLTSLDAGSTVPGWTNAFWNGTTAPVLARYIINNLAFSNITGLLHTASITIRSKYDLLVLICREFNLDIQIQGTSTPCIDRTLATRLNSLELPNLTPLLVGIKELADEYKKGLAGVTE